MKDNSRTKKAGINSVFGLLSYVINVLIQFFLQRVFVRILGYEFLGLNSVLTTIISTLSIAELGIGSAIAFSLYKPISEGDTVKIGALMRLYKKIYSIIGLIVLCIGLCLIPALPAITKNEFTIIELLPVYSIFLGNSVLSYFFTYNQTLLSADQKNYILSIISTVTRIFMSVLQLVVLYVFENYVIYLVVMLVCTVLSNLFVCILVWKKYPYIRRGDEKLDVDEKARIKGNVTALIYHKIGNYLVTGTDSLIISAFLGTAFAGFYANYTLISNSITSIVSNFFAGIVAGFGNLIATTFRPHIKQVFKRVRFLNFWIYTIGSAGIFVLSNTFISMWMGDSLSIQPWYFILIFTLNFYITGYSSALGNIRAAAGAFAPDKYLHIVIAILNLIISLVLVNFIGLTGVLLGTTICLIIKECIVLPIIGSKHIYGGKTWHYYVRFLYDIIVMAFAVLLCWWINSLISISNPIQSFIVGMIICIIVPSIVIVATSFWSDEFRYFVGMFSNCFKKIITKINIKKELKVEILKMHYEKTALDGVIIVNPSVHGDNRGWFMETFRDDELKLNGISSSFVQDNQSFSAQKGTLRGIHYQNYPFAQSKLVRCLRGAILDVAVDLRSWSPTYKQWVAVMLSAENKKQLYIPRGFGHGFVTLTDDVEIAYKCDDYYNKTSEGGIRFDDPELGIDWGIAEPILSEKDKNAPCLKDADLNFNVRVLVTGASGQLGYDVVKLLKSKGIECIGSDKEDFDITDKFATEHFLSIYKPTVIVHCAAYTAVDSAEENKEICYKVNVVGTKNIADYCTAHNIILVHISSDYVYGSNGKHPLKETDETTPLSVYGQTKLAAEKEAEKVNKHFILRTSGVFGRHGNNFIKTMLKLSESKSELTVVDDEIGAPTYTVDLAYVIMRIIFTQNYGIYNVNNEGECSWCELAKTIFERVGKKIKVNKITTEKYGSKALRQLNSRLDKTKLYSIGMPPMPTWQEALDRYLKEIL